MSRKSCVLNYVQILEQVYLLHQHDQNFPVTVLERINLFLNDPEIQKDPLANRELIREMKLEALLVTENSPYAQVRAVVSNTDDPTLPSFTIRTWVIGVVYVVAGAFVNQLFSIRQPAISISSEVAQLLACELFFRPEG